MSLHALNCSESHVIGKKSRSRTLWHLETENCGQEKGERACVLILQVENYGKLREENQEEKSCCAEVKIQISDLVLKELQPNVKSFKSFVKTLSKHRKSSRNLFHDN